MPEDKPPRKQSRKANGEGSIWKYEARGIYRGSVTVGYYPNGRPKRKTVQGASEAIVKKKIKALIAQVDAGYADPGTMTVSQWLDRYYTIYCEPRIRPKTQDLYKYFVQWWSEQFAQLKLSKLQPFHIQAAINELAKTKSRSSIQAGTIFLNAAIKQALREDLLKKNPVEGVKLAGRVTEKIRAATEEEVKKLASIWNLHRYGIIVPMLLETGMRIGELLALTWDDVAVGQISISKTVIVHRVGHTTETIIGDTKTSESRRVIPATKEFMDLHNYLWQRRNEDKLKAGQHWEENNLIIASEKGWIAAPNNVSYTIRKMCLSQGITPITPHQLRHTYATRAITAGVNPRIVQELLGHSDITTTMKTYAEVEEIAKVEAVKKITQMTAGSAMSNSVASALRPKPKL